MRHVHRRMLVLRRMSQSWRQERGGGGGEEEEAEEEGRRGLLPRPTSNSWLFKVSCRSILSSSHSQEEILLLAGVIRGVLCCLVGSIMSNYKAEEDEYEDDDEVR